MANEQQKEQPQALTELTEAGLERVMTAAMKAARQPTTEEQKKIDEEKARLLQRKATMQRMVKTEEREKARRQANCSHRKPDGELCVGGQAMSSGREVMICLRCQKVIVDEPTREMVLAEAQLQRLSDEGKLKIINGKVQVNA